MINKCMFLVCVLVVNLTANPFSAYFCNFTCDRDISLVFPKDFNYVEVYDPIFGEVVKNVEEYSFIPNISYKIKLVKFHNNVFFKEDFSYNFIKISSKKILLGKGWKLIKVGNQIFFVHVSSLITLLLLLALLLVLLNTRFLLIFMLLLLLSPSFSQNYLVVENNTLKHFGKSNVIYSLLNVTPIEIHVQKVGKYEKFVIINNLPRKICLNAICYGGIIEEVTPINLDYFKSKSVLCVDKSSVGFLRVKFLGDLHCYFSNESVDLKVSLKEGYGENVGYLLDTSNLKVISTNNSKKFLVSVVDYASNLISLVKNGYVKFFDNARIIDMYRFKLRYSVLFFKETSSERFHIDVYPSNLSKKEIYVFYPKIAWDGSLTYMIINDGNRTIRFEDTIVNPGEIKTRKLVFKNSFLGEENVVFLMKILGKVYIMPTGYCFLDVNNKVVGNCYQIKNKTLCILNTHKKKIIKVVNSTNLRIIFESLTKVSNRSTFFVFFYPFRREFLFTFNIMDIFMVYFPIVFLIVILFYYNFLEDELIRK